MEHSDPVTLVDVQTPLRTSLYCSGARCVDPRALSGRQRFLIVYPIVIDKPLRMCP
jgi:hypothetical protein